MSESDPHRTIDAIWRIESARLIAGLTRIVRDVGLAEELAQDALVAAVEQWPRSGVPDNPGAWLMGTARHRAIDLLRRRKRLERNHEELGQQLAEEERRPPATPGPAPPKRPTGGGSRPSTSCWPGQSPRRWSS